MFTGVGLDLPVGGSTSYAVQFRTLAVYADARYYQGKKKRFFGRATAGLNFLLDNNVDNDFSRVKGREGLYAGLGAGYRSRLGREVFYTFDISYQFRQSRYHYSYRPWWNGQWQTQHIDARQYMLVISMGLEL